MKVAFATGTTIAKTRWMNLCAIHCLIGALQPLASMEVLAFCQDPIVYQCVFVQEGSRDRDASSMSTSVATSLAALGVNAGIASTRFTAFVPRG